MDHATGATASADGIDRKSLQNQTDQARLLWRGYCTENPEGLRPVVFEFSGSPKSGKTTCIDIVQHFFKRQGFRTWAPGEGASQLTPYNLRRDLVAFNTWTLNYAISELLLACFNVNMPDLVFLDRGPFDSLAWMNMLAGEQDARLTTEELSTIERFAVHPKWASLVDRVFLLTCEPGVSLQRENRSKLVELPGTAMNEPTLARLLEAYSDLPGRLGELNGDSPPEVFSADTSNEMEPARLAARVVEEILHVIRVRCGQ